MARKLVTRKAPQGHPLKNGPAGSNGARFQRSGGALLAGSRSGGKRTTKGRGAKPRG
jgi:hypothetical protein